MPFEPRKIVKLAEPGQVGGYGRLIRKDVLDEDYAEAAPIAYAHPSAPVIVHEYDMPPTEDGQKHLDRYLATEQRTALKLMNEADAGKRLPRPEGFKNLTVPTGLERFQVSITTSTPEKVVRTYVIFHPNGRPIHTRKRRSEGVEQLPELEQLDERVKEITAGDPDETDADRRYEAREVGNRADVGEDF